MKISTLSAASPSVVKEVRAIYLKSFPPSERIPFSELLDPPENEQREVFVLTEGEQVHGFASVFRLQSFPALLLEFLAVHGDRRNKGYGAVLWRHVRATATALQDVKGLILEVEDPDEAGLSSADVALRRRRIRFYTRGGATVLPVTGYRVPSRLGGPDLPLRLLWAPDNPLPPLSEAQLSALVDALLAESYGVTTVQQATVSKAV